MVYELSWGSLVFLPGVQHAKDDDLVPPDFPGQMLEYGRDHTFLPIHNGG